MHYRFKTSFVSRPIVQIIALAIGLQVLAINQTAQAQFLPHSYARPDQVKIKHLHLDAKVDFETKRISGSATLTLERTDPQAMLQIDADGLEIRSVKEVGGQALTFKQPPVRKGIGEGLVIELPAVEQQATKVIVEYATDPAAAAVQWLSSEQTTDKKHPFLFTQSQAILARTWVPCQDTPAVRMTYSAKLQVPKELLAVMSAANPQKKNDTGVYEFQMQQPIPSYLLALAVGDLKFVGLSERSGVYAERSVLKKAAWELADTERMIVAAEKLYGPYRWDRYDVIFLPSSFPFGGMENPRLTFATPTILAGDRSLVALVAHELAHSWSGNLVTNAAWDDFWLNEGFTVYFEQRIMEAVYGRRYSEMLAKLNLDGLQRELVQLKKRDTWLKLDLTGRNPDDGLTAIAYDKGYFFLRALEENVGREKWDVFLKNYFDKFASQSMTTEGFLKHLKANLEVDVDLDSWVYSAGLPASIPVVQTEELNKVAAAVKAFTDGTEPAKIASQFNTADWTTHHWNHFLRSLETAALSKEQMAALDGQFKFTESGNSEITHDWLLLVIAADYQPAMNKLEAFLTGQGRRKFLTQLYTKLVETESGKKLAKKIYAIARPGYHSVSRDTIDEILKE